MRLGLLILLATAGCAASGAAGDGDRDGTAAADSALAGSVALERVVSFAADASARTRVSARFVRESGDPGASDADRLVSPAAARSAGPARGCAWLDEQPSESASPKRDRRRPVELVDVGDIVLVAGATAMPLAQRAFPDVGGLVSGVVYTSRDDAVDLPVAPSYRLETSGADGVEPFRAEVTAPGALAGVMLAGAPIGSIDSFAADEPLIVTWEPSASPDRDRVVIDLTGGGRVLRCGYEDRGTASVPAALFASLAAATRDIEISIHRHRREAIAAGDGAVVGAFDFDFAVAAHLSFAAPGE